MAGTSPRGWSPWRVTLLSSALFIPFWARKLQPPRQPPPCSSAASSSSSRRMDTAEEQRELCPMAASVGMYLIQAGGRVAVVSAVPRQRLGWVHWRVFKRPECWRELWKHKRSCIISSFLSCLWVLDSLWIAKWHDYYNVLRQISILHSFWNCKYHSEPGCLSTDSGCCFKENQ